MLDDAFKLTLDKQFPLSIKKESQKSLLNTVGTKRRDSKNMSIEENQSIHSISKPARMGKRFTEANLKNSTPSNYNVEGYSGLTNLW